MNFFVIIFLIIVLGCSTGEQKPSQPNFLIIYTDDQRYNAAGFMGNEHIHTPHLDSLANQGMVFDQAFVTLSICSPSRAALLTGRYGSANGVTTFGDVALNQGETTFANKLKQTGYQTGMIGKWHLKTTSKEAGFDYAGYFFSNGPWYDRNFIDNGKERTANGYIEEYIAERSIAFLDSVSQNEAPFLLFHCTQVPHLDNHFEWDVRQATLDKYYQEEVPLPENWDDDLAGKPPYLKTGRHRQKAITEYHYNNPDTVRNDLKRYYAAITEMDAQLGRIFNHLEELGIEDNTYIVFMGDNGWFLGEHKFTSKVLAYEESIHVPFFVAGPGVQSGRSDEIVLNIDIFPTIMDIVGKEMPANLHGKSLWPMLQGNDVDWREQFFYEAPEPQLGSRPLYAIRSKQWKYIQTFAVDNRDSLVFEELYNLEKDPHELHNLANENQYSGLMEEFTRDIREKKPEINQ